MRPHTRTSCAKKGECEGKAKQIALVELPAEVIVKILQYMSYKEVSAVRRVSRRLNELCAARLNTTFQRMQSQMLVRFQTIKSQMPRRESARRNHPLARECDIVETLHMRLTLLQMTFGKHIERKHICFFPGEILDEVFRIQHYICSTQPLGRAYKVTDELFDLSTMAMEYFKENIEPSLPEITYFGSDFLEFTPPFATPSKRLSSGIGFDSPMSSRASAVGSSCSEPPLPYNTLETEADYEDGVGAPQSNMVLRKRIRRIRAGMKKYNTQLDEVKRELKTCKSKMDNQTKQVTEYASRMEDYDKKFEENSRKFGTLLSELNKCKTELQYYRSRSHLMQCLNCGSSLAENSENAGNSDNTDFAMPEPVGILDVSVDKQAMVEDWLNPDNADNNIAPQVQHNKQTADPTGNCPCPGTSAQQKISKTADDQYLRTGPGSPGYTRASPRSPAAAAAGPSSPSCSQLPQLSRAGKRKSRDTAAAGLSAAAASHTKTTRCKRPKLQQAN